MLVTAPGSQKILYECSTSIGKSYGASLTEAAKPVNTVLYLYEQEEPTLVSWEHRVVTSLKPAVLFKRMTYLRDRVSEETQQPKPVLPA